MKRSGCIHGFTHLWLVRVIYVEIPFQYSGPVSLEGPHVRAWKRLSKIGPEICAATVFQIVNEYLKVYNTEFLTLSSQLASVA